MANAGDRLAAAIIRLSNPNSYAVQNGASDEELLQLFGAVAKPLTEALQAVIRDEVSSAVNDQTPGGWA